MANDNKKNAKTPAASKKPKPKASAKILTKDGVADTAAFEEQENVNGIDMSVFDAPEQDDEFELPLSDYVRHTSTIDESILDSARLKQSKRGKNKKNANTVDMTKAVRFDPDYLTGLTSEQVAKRIEDGYDNFVKKKGGKTYLSIFVTNIFTFFNIMCYIVAIALIVVNASFSQLFFMLIIGANIVIGIFQEIRAKMTIDKLRLLTAPTAFVIRDGEKTPVPVSEVVLDDIIYLEMGKQIPTDSIVVKGECEVNESLLTGESEPVKKQKGDILYAGSFVSSGSCYARADKVGKGNYIETLTSYAQKYKKPKSELMNSIKLIIKVLSPFIVTIGALTVWTGYNSIVPAGVPATWQNWNEIITKAAGSVIGMIPAGMFLLTSLALFASVLRLAKKKTLVQDLYCIEMLARVDVLCLDKTGTITDGSMEVNNVIEIKGFSVERSPADIIGSMLTATQDNNQTALALAAKFGYNKILNPKTVLPFSSQRKLSAVTFEGEGTFMLGAPEFVLKDMGVRIEKIINENAANGYRVLVLAHSPAEIIDNKLPAVRRPLCLIVVEDHIRDDAYSTIKWFKENNVAVRVISGDNPITVSEVARRVGVADAEKYISLDGLSNQEVIEAASKYTVFGRVTPEQKRLLVKSLKAKGHTVAMTGDGVNDILAMREADCSVSIASGAEAARNVSHLVLLDSNFTSMPDVVMEGRRVVNNIQSSSALYLMKTFMALVLSIIYLAMQEPYPLQTNHSLALEVCVIGAPSFFLALQTNKNIIRGKFLSNVFSRAIPAGIALVLGVMSVYVLNIIMPMESAQVTCMMVYMITCIGLMVLFKLCEPYNAYRIVLMIGAVVLTMLFMLINPQLDLVTLNMTQIFFTAAWVLLSYFIVSILMKVLSYVKLK